ncbi:hypothetical protein Mapa_008810 [Marchantia paleacea]|nr:hypothetical protein Mapa_008810 [Marchantia paleacea]
MSQVIHLQPSQILWRAETPYRRKDGPLGLRNLGNTCYFNSVLQCLTYTPPLANLCLQGQHSSACVSRNDKSNNNCAFCFLEKRIRLSLTIDVPVDSPTKILDCLQRSTKLFRVGRQEDAHELLRYAIEACNSACIQLQKPVAAGNRQSKHADGKSKEEPHTIVKEIFGGIIQSQIKCSVCGTESNKLDDIMDLSLDILPRLGSLREAMCRFFMPEVLDGDNKYHCSKCKKPTTARKQLSVFKAPTVLVIQLKRFENIYGGKIDRHVAFDERLGLAGHMCRNSKDARPEYMLYGVVVHAGHSQDGGHYYAYVKEPRGKWYCCNDASVYPVNPDNVRADKAYILFYVRSNSAPEVSSVNRNDSTPSPPTTPDTDLQEPPKKYGSPHSSATHSKLSNSTLVNSRVNSKKQMRFKIRNVNDPPEKAGRDDQFSNKHIIEGASPTCVSLPNQMPCSSNAKHSCEGFSPPCIFVPEQVSGSNFDVGSSSARLKSDGDTVSSVYSGDKVLENRTQAGAMLEDQNTRTDLRGVDLRRNSSRTSNGAESTDGVIILAVAGPDSAGNTTLATSEETRLVGAKRQRDEAKCSVVVLEDPQFAPLLETPVSDFVQRQVLKSAGGDEWLGIGRFKQLLEKETREELLGGGWGDELRERLRAVKRMKKSEGLWPADAAKTSTLSRQLFAEERELCKDLVPKVLKERLVEHLRSYICQKSAK